MIARNAKRVVIINNIKSDKIEQAIFILKGSSSQKVDRFIVREAQEIIDKYIKRVEAKEEPVSGFPAPRRRRLRLSGGVLTVICSLALLSIIILLRAVA